jgi:CubicO group peptidase (beta-lactamase class C family)
MRTLAILGLVACHPDKTTTDTTPSTTDSGSTPTGTTSTGDTAAPTTTTPAIRDSKFDAAAAALLEELVPNLAEGASIAVMEHGRYTWVEGFGTADPTGDVPVTPGMAFQIGSTTKQMTSTLVLRGVDAGRYTLDDTVATLLPDFALASDPTWAGEATLHRLISHQGGLVDYLDWTAPADDADLAAWHYDVFGPNLWAMSPPGAFWNYSNPNFTLAGLVVEAHDPAGRYYPDVLAEDVFAPLGMTASFIRKSDVLAYGDYALSTGVNAADPYAPAGPVSMDDITDPASIRPAGLAWSTPSDMCRWGSFVIDGDPSVLSDPLRAEITTPQVDTLYYDGHYAYGYGEFVWDLFPLSDGWYPIRVWEHGGNTLSFTSVLLMLPDQDTVVSILSNGYGDQWPATTEALIRAIVDPLPAASTYAGPTFDPSELATHAGQYFDPYNVGEVDVTPGGAYGLQISMPLLDQYGFTVNPDLIPISTDWWVIDLGSYGYVDFNFIRDPAGGQDLYLRNRSFVPWRVEATDTGTTSAARRAAPTREQVEQALIRGRSATPIHLPTR